MSWLFSQALVAEFSEATCWDGAPSAPLSEIPTPQAYLPADKMTEFSRLSRFGMTFAPLTDAPGAELLTWYLAGFPAKTSAAAARKKASGASAAGSGRKCYASFARLDRATSSWRTSQRCLVEGWEQFSQTWPKQGLMLDGECWELPTLVATSSASGSGLWPALKASDGDQYSKNLDYFKRRAEVAADLPVVVGLTTPPTPQGYYGRINPVFAEWLMGWPIGWTGFAPLETDKIHEWQRQHSPCLPSRESA